jgi:hypothetical protein
MAFNFGGTQANVNISGGIVLQKNVVRVLTNAAAGANNVTMGTVGAGKVWRVIGFSLNSDNNAAAEATSNLTMGGNVVAATIGSGTATGVGDVLITFHGSYSDAIVLSAGQTVVHNSNANGRFSAAVYYVEESA